MIGNAVDRQLDSYTIGFRIDDRNGGQLYSGHFRWERGVAEAKGNVSDLICEHLGQPGNQAVAIPATIPSYANIRYWIETIQSSNPEQSEKQNAIAEKLANASVKKAEDSGHRQAVGCKLEVSSLCQDYSKSVGFRSIALNAHVDVAAEAKKLGLIVVSSKEKKFVSYDIYKNRAAKTESAKMLTVQVDNNGIVKRLEWSNNQWSFPIHTEGMKKYLDDLKATIDTDGASFLGVGSNGAFMLETKIFGLVNQSAGVGIRPPEVEKKPSNSFKAKVNSTTKRYIFEDARTGTRIRSEMFDGIDDCNHSREVELQAATATATEAWQVPKQTECYAQESKAP
jgi:hypothetical protein